MKDFVCNHTLPKCYLGRIQKFWEKIIPSDYPLSNSSFSVTFGDDDTARAVFKMEDEINSENCVAISAIPENTFVSSYVGVYEVDGTPGELTLLSPEKVSSDNVVALHYNKENDSWENIEGIQIIDGYVWGTLDSFSPIAVFEYKDDVIVIDGFYKGLDKKGESVVVANGNSIKVYGKDDKIFFVGPSGVPVEITKRTSIVGGTIDGRAIESTNVTIIDVNNTDLISCVYGGSALINRDEIKVTTVDNVNVKIINSNLHVVTGSTGAVRTNNVNIYCVGSTLDYMGSGQSYPNGGPDVNNANNLSFASEAWVKNSNIVVAESKISIFYNSGDSGYLYNQKSVAFIDNSKIDYLTTGGSNGHTDTDEVTVTNSNVKVFQTSNRGGVDSSSSKIDNCEIKYLYIGGETPDKAVKGTTGIIKMDIGSGIYNIVPGTDGGVVISNNNNIASIKVSRSADVTISSELLAILGNKYIVK